MRHLTPLLDVWLLTTFFYYWFWEAKRERGRERNSDLLFQLFTHPLVDSCMGSAQGLNLRPWHIGTRLLPPQLPSQGHCWQLLSLTFSLSLEPKLGQIKNPECPLLCCCFEIQSKQSLDSAWESLSSLRRALTTVRTRLASLFCFLKPFGVSLRGLFCSPQRPQLYK